jgi:hypothetical protein
MKRARTILTLIALTLHLAIIVFPAQQSKTDSIVGVVVESNSSDHTLRIKADSGVVTLIKTDDATICLRIPAGETTLAKAIPIQLSDIAVGDRILGSGARTEKDFEAQRLIVLTKTDVAKKREKDLDDWQRRGIGGIVRELNAQTGEINLELRGTGAGGRVMIASNKADFLRYSPASLKFEDARASNFSELKPGDQLRALGDKSSDGRSLKAEKIVSGAFRTTGVTVTEIDLQRKEIKATTLDQKKPVVISITDESVLRRIPLPVAQAIAQKALAANKPANGSPAAPKAAPSNQNIDVQQVTDSLPKISASDLKAGDVLAVTSAVDKDEAHLTAIKLVAGVDLVLKAMAPQPGKPQVVRLSAGLPTVFDFSVVQ